MYLLTAVRRSTESSTDLDASGGVRSSAEYAGGGDAGRAPDDGGERRAGAGALVRSSVTSSMLDAKVDEINMLRTELVEAQRRREDAEDVLRRLGNPCC